MRVVCLRQAKAVSIEGHTSAVYNGVYTHDSTHEGWPVLKSDKGTYCYRYTSPNKWYLSNVFTPDKDVCAAHIVAKEGPLPVGAHTWQVLSVNLRQWVEGSLTVTLQ